MNLTYHEFTKLYDYIIANFSTNQEIEVITITDPFVKEIELSGELKFFDVLFSEATFRAVLPCYIIGIHQEQSL